MLPLARFALPALLSAALAFAPAGQARAGLNDFEKFALVAGSIAILGVILAQPVQSRAPAPHTRRPIRVMPAHCLRQGQAGHRAVHVLPQYCLARAGVHVATLPGACRVHMRGIGPGYLAGCLRARGFVIA